MSWCVANLLSSNAPRLFPCVFMCSYCMTVYPHKIMCGVKGHEIPMHVQGKCQGRRLPLVQVVRKLAVCTISEVWTFS